MSTKRAPLCCGEIYHIFNRAHHQDLMFSTPANYRFFLSRYFSYLGEYVDTFCFCLLPNHFHFLVRVKMQDAWPGSTDMGVLETAAPVSEQFRRLFTSYAKAYNKQESRRGGLFQRPFQRKRVYSAGYLTRLITYIHTNPQKHRIVNDFRKYPWSSYGSVLARTPTAIQRDEVLEWFGSRAAYRETHSDAKRTRSTPYSME